MMLWNLFVLETFNPVSFNRKPVHYSKRIRKNATGWSNPIPPERRYGDKVTPLMAHTFKYIQNVPWDLCQTSGCNKMSHFEKTMLYHPSHVRSSAVHRNGHFNICIWMQLKSFTTHKYYAVNWTANVVFVTFLFQRPYRVVPLVVS
jgi:hypothetical protein